MREGRRFVDRDSLVRVWIIGIIKISEKGILGGGNECVKICLRIG